MNSYMLYGTKLIENDDTLKDFAISLVKNIPRDDLNFDYYIEVISGSLRDDIVRTDIDYVELLCKYKSEIGNVLYEMDNNGYVMPKIDFFNEGAEAFFKEIVMAYIELILLSEERDKCEA